jgi:hypothetical protein
LKCLYRRPDAPGAAVIEVAHQGGFTLEAIVDESVIFARHAGA